MGAVDRVRRAGRVLLGRPAVPSRQQDAVESELLTIGRHTYDRPAVHRYPDGSRVVIGSFCSIAGGVEIMTGGNHHPEWVSTFPFELRFDLQDRFEDRRIVPSGEVVVGNDVWIGRGAKILSGVTIGDGAVVGAYTVVARNVEPYSIVAGNPARHIRYRFPPEIVRALLRIRWWEWPDDVVRERATELNDADVEAFVARYAPST